MRRVVLLLLAAAAVATAAPTARDAALAPTPAAQSRSGDAARPTRAAAVDEARRDPAAVARRAFSAAVGAIPVVADARAMRADKAATRVAGDAAVSVRNWGPGGGAMARARAKADAAPGALARPHTALESDEGIAQGESCGVECLARPNRPHLPPPPHPQALAAHLQDPEVRTILLSRDVELSDAAWAPVGSAVVTRRVTVAPVNTTGRVAIDFGRLISAVVLVGDRAKLTFDRVWLRGLAPRAGVRQEGLTRLRPGGALTLWPSIVTLPNTTLALSQSRVDIASDDGFSNCTSFGARVEADAAPLGVPVVLAPDGRDALLAGTFTVGLPLAPPGADAAPAGNASVASTDTVLTCVPAPARPGRTPVKRVALPIVNAAGSVADPPAARPPNTPHPRLKWWLAFTIALSCAVILALLGGLVVLTRRLRALQKQRSLRRAAKAGGGGGSDDAEAAALSLRHAGSAAAPASARAGGDATDVELGPLLGRGSYGRVYKARWKGTLVAVKAVDDADPAAVAREAALALAVTHPNVVATYEVLEVGGGRGGGGARAAADADAGPARSASTPGTETWIVLEYMDRGTLDAAVAAGRFAPKGARGARDDAAVWACLKDVAAGLAYLHGLGIVHGDLSTANVLLKSTAADARGFVCKVSDFGLSRLLADRATHVSTKSYGTVRAMPPELLKDGRMGTAADVYAFGVLAWELAAGGPAYGALPTAAIFYKVAVEGGRPPLLEGAPAGVNELCSACWSVDPAARPTADALLATVSAAAAAARAAARRGRAPADGGDSAGSSAPGAGGGGAHSSGAPPPPPPPAPAATPFASPPKPAATRPWGRRASWGRRDKPAAKLPPPPE